MNYSKHLKLSKIYHSLLQRSITINNILKINKIDCDVRNELLNEIKEIENKNERILSLTERLWK